MFVRCLLHCRQPTNRTSGHCLGTFIVENSYLTPLSSSTVFFPLTVHVTLKTPQYNRWVFSRNQAKYYSECCLPWTLGISDMNGFKYLFNTQKLKDVQKWQRNHWKDDSEKTLFMACKWSCISLTECNWLRNCVLEVDFFSGEQHIKIIHVRIQLDFSLDVSPVHCRVISSAHSGNWWSYVIYSAWNKKYMKFFLTVV